jgi:hypothetical protein
MAAAIDERAWSICGMILIRKRRSTWRQTCPGATWSIIWAELGPNLGLRGERQATNRLGHVAAYLRVLCAHTQVLLHVRLDRVVRLYETKSQTYIH